MPAESSADALCQSTTFTSIADVVGGLALPDRVRGQLHKGLEECGEGPDATMNAVTGPLRELRAETGDPHLVKEVGKRFAAFLGNGLYKSLTQPPPGFQAIPNSRMGGMHKKVGASYVYWYPGQGVTRQHQEQGPAPGQGGLKAAPAGQKNAQMVQAQHTNQQPAGNQRMTQRVLEQDAMSRTADPNQPHPLSETLGGHDPDEFNKLSTVERANKTAKWADVASELEEHAAPQQYAVDSHEAVLKSAMGHIRQLQADGTFSPDGSRRAAELAQTMTQHAKVAGVEPHLFADLMHRNIQKIGLQEQKATERTIGDHGVRHITVNVQTAHKVLDALKEGGMPVEPMDYLASAQVMIDHDMGYAIPAIHQGGFAVNDKYHPQASRALWEQQPEMAKIFGREGWAEMGRLIESHSGSDIDWEKDPLGSATRLADNCHLFADKMPEILFDSRKGVELMAKLKMLKDSLGFKGKKGEEKPAGLKEGVAALKKALMSHIESRSDIPMQQRHRLLTAANEIGVLTDTFLVSRLAGRSPKFEFDAGSKSMNVNIEHSATRGAIADVFGPDEEDKQFMKMLEDFGIKKGDQDKLQSPPPPTRVDVPPSGTRKASFSWAAGGAGSEGHEAEFGQIMKDVQREYQGIAALPEAERGPKMQAWLGELTKGRRAVPVILL